MSLQKANLSLPELLDNLCNPDIPQIQKKNHETEFIRLIQTCQLTLNEVIKELGAYLVNQDDRIRSKAYYSLNLVLSNIPLNEASNTHPQTIASLMRFFGDRLDDFDCLNELLSCVLSLFNTWKNLMPDDQLAYILSRLTNEVNVQSLNQKARNTALEIYNYYLLYKPNFCKSDFVGGFVRAIDGERDPVNLIKIFSMVPRLAAVAPNFVSGASEELFEVLSVYFPISFNPPADDPRGITAEQLSIGLNASLACHPSLASFTIPFLLEKLSSSLIETKVVTFDTLAYCIEQYGEPSVRMFLTEIWNYIRTEILRTSNLDVLHSALEAIKTICGTVCNTPNREQNQKNMEGLIKPALMELKSPENKFAPLYGRIIYSVTCSSPECCDLVSFRLLQELSLILYESKTRDMKRGVLVIGTQLLEALINQHQGKEIQSSKYVSVLWDSVSSIVDDQQLRKEIIEILCRFSAFPNQVNSQLIFNFINKTLLDDDKALAKNAIEGVKWIYRFNAEGVRDNILTPILSDSNMKEHFSKIIFVVTQLATDCQGLAPFIVDALSLLLVHEFHSLGLNSNNILLATLNALVEKSVISSDKAMQYLHAVIKLSIEAFYNDRTSDMDRITLQLMSKLLHILYRDLQIEEQQRIFDQLYRLVFESKIDIFYTPTVSSKIFSPLQDTSESCAFFFPIYSSIFVATRPEVNIANIKLHANNFSALSVSNVIPNETSEAAAQCLASLINKYENLTDAYFESIKSEFIDGRILKFALAKDVSIDRRIRAVQSLGWVMKALTMRGSNLSSNLSSALYTLLLDSSIEISTTAADAFGIIMAEHEIILHKKTHAKCIILYKQKFFSMNINSLLDCIRQARAEKSHNESSILFAVAYLIHNVPKSVVLSEVERLFPLVMNVLAPEKIDRRSKDIIIAALKTTETLLQDAKEQMSNYLSRIVPILLKLATQRISIKIRLLSIECLSVIAQYPFHNIFSVRQQIINGLEKALDDPKRKVRKVAVRVRNEWFVLNKE
jgi:DNA repair/transcription protein MET18/MMS19